MGERIMRCEKCNKQTAHVKEGRKYQIRSSLEIFYKCSECGAIVKVRARIPKNAPQGYYGRPH